MLLATILLGKYDKNGARILLRALLDQCSQITFISENAAQTLGLNRNPISAVTSGIGERDQKAKHMVQLTIFPCFESNFVLTCDAIVLPKVTCVKNNQHTNGNFEFLNNLTLTDPSYLKKDEIDIILSAAQYAQIIKWD